MKKTIALLLTLTLVFSLALPAFAFPASEGGDARDQTFGIARGYVRTKEAYRDQEGSTHTYVWTYNKQGKRTKETETAKSGDFVSRYVTKWVYDKQGNLKKQITYSTDSVTTDVFTYNSKGLLKKQARSIVYEDNSVFASTRTYSYNKAGKVLEERSWYDDCEETASYSYNKAGDPVKEVRIQAYEDNTRTVTTTTHTYDESGNEIKMRMVEKDRYGAVEKRSYVTAYDGKGRCVKTTQTCSYANNGRVETDRDVTTYAYDKNGNVTKEVFKSVSGSGYRRTVTFVNTYDKKGRLIKEVTAEQSPDYTGKTAKVYTYDKKGQLVKETTVAKSGGAAEKTTETYAYDKAGNLTGYTCSGSSGISVTAYTYQKVGK